MSDEKTEKPTEKKLEDARRDGEVAKSQDLTAATVFLLVAITMWVGGDFFGDRLKAILRIGLDIQAIQRDDFDLFRAMGKIGLEGVMILIPFVIATTLAAIVGIMAQIGIVISLKPVEPKFDAINPANGLKRIFSLRSMVDLAKMLVSAVLVASVVWLTIRSLLPLVVGTAYASLSDVIHVAWTTLSKFMGIGCVLFLILGAPDFGIQKWLFIRDHKMSKDEVKREDKDVEGDPLIKGQRRQIAREIVESPVKESVGMANVVVVNPTHYAVAIRYSVDEMGIPQVVAKGVDHHAFQIRTWAQELDVPIVSNPPLARALYKVPVNDSVPESLFETVAVILRWVEQLGAQRSAEGLPPSSTHASNAQSPSHPE